MIAYFFVPVATVRRMSCGPLGPYLDSFADQLRQQGYSKRAGMEKIGLIADLSRWLDRKKIKIETLDEQRVVDFLTARRKRFCRHFSDEPTLAQWLGYLRQANLIPTPLPTQESPRDRLAQEYAQFLSQERGLGQATIDHYLRVARSFLSYRFGSGRICLNQLRVPDVTGFILHDTSALSRKAIHLRTTVLRSFLGFVHQRGKLTANLAAAVPTVAHWRLSGVPSFLEPEQVEELLQGCDQDREIGRRDYAILLLLARLGLRAGEVARLSLDDFNWEAGELQIRGKGAREHRLPLPWDVGQALARYIEKDRPACSARQVFIRIKAPHQNFSHSATISGIVRRALHRIQLHPPHMGAHLLRHALATQMLRKGGSLAQIGQILGHQRAQTTEIYAKVDLMALRALAQPWPGGVQ